MRVLAVNAGSSSVKLSVIDTGPAGRSDTVSSTLLPGDLDLGAVQAYVQAAGAIDAVGHRVVHGGTRYVGPVVVGPADRRRLEDLVELAPLHQPASLAALDAVCQLLPSVPAVACFDTAFFAAMPAAASTYALPKEWRERWPLRRFGFHGLSHAYCAGRAAELAASPAGHLRVVTCHLGAGASLAAVTGGRAVDTTMGFTPLEGLVMATRSGTVDPGLVLWLAQRARIPTAELADALEKRSGLSGLAGSPDMRQVLEAVAGGDPDATLAVEVYLHRLRASVAAMAASMGGLDVLVFTAGVGEHSAEIRRRCAAGLGFLGVQIDPDRNEGAEPDVSVAAPGSKVETLVVAAREDLRIAHEVAGLLGH